MPVGRPTKYKPEMCETVIDIGNKGGSKAEMAMECGICHDTLLEYQKKHPEFSEAIKKAVQNSQVWWERQAKLATFGGTEGFSASAFIFQMKNRFPKDYRDKQQLEHSGDLEVNVIIGGAVDADPES